MEPYNAKFYLQKRYLVTLMIFFGWMLMFLMRTNLSISIVDMTSERLVTVGNETVTKAEFEWSSTEKGVILSAFSWGYMTAPIGALIATKYGGVRIFGAGIALTGFLTMLSPILMSWSLRAYLVARTFEGVFEAAAASSVVEALRPWSPPGERSRLIAGSHSGCVLGTMLSFPICGTVAHHFNWQTIFYVTGAIPLLWAIIWFAVIRNYPEEDNLMSVREKQYLKQFNETNTKKKVVIPWRQILKSKPVLAYWNDRFVEAWSVSFLVYSLPIYIKDVHNVDIQNIGLISGIPHFCAAVGMIGGSILADFLRNSGWISISNGGVFYHATMVFPICCVRKMHQPISDVQSSTVGTCLNATIRDKSKKDRMLWIWDFDMNKLLVLTVDMGGQYACVISGIGTSALGLGYSLSSLVMGLIVSHHSTSEWSTYFLVLSIFNLWGGIFFFLFGSGKLQSWAAPSDDTENAEKETVTDAKMCDVDLKL